MKRSGFVLLFAFLVQVASAQIQPVVDLGVFGAGGKNDVFKLELQVVNRFDSPLLLGTISRTNVVGTPEHPIVQRTFASFVTVWPIQGVNVNVLVLGAHGTLVELPAGINGAYTVSFKSGRAISFTKTSASSFEAASAQIDKSVAEFNAKAITKTITKTTTDTMQLALIEGLRSTLTTVPSQMNVQVKISEALVQARNHAMDEANVEAKRITDQFAPGVTVRTNLLKKPKLKCSERDEVVAFTDTAIKTIDAAVQPKATELLRYAEATHLSLDLIGANAKVLSEAVATTRKLSSSQTQQLYPLFSSINESTLSQVSSRANVELTKTKALEEFAKPTGQYVRGVKSPIWNLITASKRDCLK